MRTEWYMRPRILFAGVFAWISMTGGRFLAPFLEHQAHFSAQEIGGALALYQMLSTLTGSAGGACADKLESRYPGKGRAMVMGLGVILGTLALFLHEIHNLFPQVPFFTTFTWFVMLRCLYAVSSSLIFPVMDGMTLAFLHEHQANRADYGKERLYGAVSWAIAHLILAGCLDFIGGFSVVYPLSLISTIVLLKTICVYVRWERIAKSRLLQKRKSGIQPSESFIDDYGENGNGDREEPESSSLSDVTFTSLLRLIAGTPYALSFLFAFFCLSLGQVVVDSLVFLYFEYLGSSYSVMGLTVILTVAFEIPIFHVAPKLLERWGCAGLLMIAAACYAFRVVAYSMIPNGHVLYALVLEPLHGVTYGCAKTAAVEFASQNTPQGYEATGQGIVQVAQGLGSVLGLLWGGWATDHIGPRYMYRISAGVVVLGNVLLACFVRRQNDNNTTHHQPIPTNQVEQDDDDLELVEARESSKAEIL